jgi:hypothetical protein
MENTIEETKHLTEEEFLENFGVMLDESQPEYQIGILRFWPAQILKNCDPISYRIALAEYADSLIEDGYTIEGYSAD